MQRSSSLALILSLLGSLVAVSTAAAAPATKPKAVLRVSPGPYAVGATLTLDAKGSSCRPGPCRYEWKSSASARTLSRTQKATLALTRAGKLKVTLRVTDKRRRTASAARTLTVVAAPAPGPAFQTPLPAPSIVLPSPSPSPSPSPEATPVATPVVTPTATVAPGPVVPAVTSPASGALLSTSTVVLAGTADAGSTVRVFEGASERGSGVTAGDRRWTITLAAVADGAHAYAFAATSDGRSSARSPELAVRVDTTAPETKIDAAPADPTAAAPLSFGFSADEGGATFRCRLEGPDGVTEGTCASPATYPAAAEGRYTFSVVATDAAGHSDPSPAQTAVRVDRTAPGTPEIIVPEEDRVQRGDEIALAGSAERETTVRVLDGTAALASVVTDEEGAWSYVATGVAEGTHVFTARASDAAGNASAASAARTVRVDARAPKTTITDGPAEPVTGTSASFAFTADEEEVTFECRLERPDAPGAFAPCSSPHVVRELTDGDHVFSVRATDRAGNVEAGGAERRFGVKNGTVGATVYVAPDGAGSGDCTRAQPCKGFAHAYAVAEPHGVIEVAAGEYGDQELPALASAKPVSVRPATGARPSLGDLDVTADDASVRGLRVTRLDIRGSRQVYDDVEVDGRFAKHVGLQHWEGDDNVFKNGRVGNITDEKGALIGPNRFTFENVVFHDVRVTDPLVHNECIYATGAEGLTIRRSTFYACATMDLFVTNFVGGPAFGNVTLENNVFTHSTMEAPDSWHFYSLGVHEVVGALRNWTVRNNTFEIGMSSGPRTGTGRWVGNLGAWDCITGVTYRYNVGQSCSDMDSGVYPASSTKTRPAPFGWLDPARLDFRLSASSLALDAADPEDFPATDRDGKPRPSGWGPDAGAYERPEARRSWTVG
ncbi:Ig-like domain-containing protein [Solirubrobacter phytolaccae]|uniref:Ig-like domain-containing protein n=1 Tax=Solirubrobacter phytolaccae TaxID=1404360 RepID=A0A9X3N8N8_9ACTN|nr:Ig-like domain-containing protein [Solirubrobacter phytolaccae]MDA0180307.1 Ig-like domain-containing protein [Solirubrobacter phytolaccae]